MLLELGVRNFKAFGDKEQKVPLSKITLIYGPNSGGKSSIIQALLMLKQSLDGEWKKKGRREPMTRGEYVDLGGFPALIYKHDIECELEIGVTFKNSSITKSGVNLILGSTKDSSFLSKLRYQILDENEVILDATLEYDPDINSWDTPQLSILGVGDSREIFPRKPSFSGKNFLPAIEILELEKTQELVRRWGTKLVDEHILAEALAEEREEIQKVSQFMEQITAEAKAQARAGGKKRAEILMKEIEKVKKQKEQGLVLVEKQVRALIPKIKPEQIAGLSLEDIPSSYEDLLRSITYMGPLRNYPERLYTISGRGRESTGIRGEFMPHILYHSPDIQTKVNEWFERFEILYELKVSEFGDVQLAGKYISIALIDKNTKTPVTLADVGFGINQLLPVIIEGIASPPNTIICVEQPEIHLHPRLQAHMADLIIDTSTVENGKQWIVETHSELLIRRIQRRISEGTLKPNDVSVLYVNPGDEGSKIEVLELDDDGNFTDEWPHGFFDEGFNELMAE